MFGEPRWQLRSAKVSDLGFLVRLRNDPVSARFSRRRVLAPDVIRAEFLETPEHHCFIASCDASEVGYASFDFAVKGTEAASAEISIALAPERRGEGLGVAFVAAATDFAFDYWEARELREIVARVHIENVASLACFERAAYLRCADESSPFSHWTKARIGLADGFQSS